MTALEVKTWNLMVVGRRGKLQLKMTLPLGASMQ